VILVVGGLGFVGVNTVRALRDQGADCVVGRHRTGTVPADLAGVAVEPVDALDLDGLRALGRRYRFTGVVHLATGGGTHPGPDAGPVALAGIAHDALASVANVLQAAHEWGVRRVSLAGAPVVYNGAALPWREDTALPMTARFPMELAKKSGELLASFVDAHTPIECVWLRLGSMYGPGYDPSRSSLVGRLVHAAVRGEPVNLDAIRFGSVYADDAGDQCHIKDAARAIASVQTARSLAHRVYNVASGASVSNRAVAGAVRTAVPGFAVELPPGHMPGLPAGSRAWSLDISRLREDVGYTPEFDITAGVADYVAWLRAGHDR
jgi:UDP-glucose 4-epimerase